jgi:catabolite regulation protein CreA
MSNRGDSNRSICARSADEPDLIFKRSTVFNWLTPNDKLATCGLDDPEVDGVARHFTVPGRGGSKVGLVETLGKQLKSVVQLTYEPSGFVYRLDVPLSSLMSVAPMRP